jgi:hypothetical protein
MSSEREREEGDKVKFKQEPSRFWHVDVTVFLVVFSSVKGPGIQKASLIGGGAGEEGGRGERRLAA